MSHGRRWEMKYGFLKGFVNTKQISNETSGNLDQSYLYSLGKFRSCIQVIVRLTRYLDEKSIASHMSTMHSVLTLKHSYIICQFDMDHYFSCSFCYFELQPNMFLHRSHGPVHLLPIRVTT